MVYLKSFLAGVVALVSVLFLGIVVFIGWGFWISHRSSNQVTDGVVAYDVSRPWIGIPLLIVAGLRRAQKANRLSG